MTPLPLDFEQPLLELEKCLDDLISRTPEDTHRISVMQEKLELMRVDLYKNLTPWQRVQIARHPSRPYALDYLERCFTDFVELHGDRCFGDDKAMPAGIARIGKYRCVIIMQQKGRNVKENVLRNFGSPHPEGYRKALRLMRLAEKFSLPVITFIDTPGAYPGIGAEERHIAESIAVNLREMMLLKVPIISVILGEGGSGGALGIGVSDKSLMLENAYYSVISPEGCAAILWKHRKHAPEAAAALKLTAQDLTDLKLIDGIVPEPLGGAHHNASMAATAVRHAIIEALEELEKKSLPDLLEERYAKFRKMGIFSE
ncbi:MAG: acetyl-CoA carboxylase carboxyltransferase subunit alpha [Verrucomicrobia bacterium]|jgi:acetyl-CoA carboxylase carboxyl transferase subunit alpha|nr:MAG: acetyl-CoA carboxylase carboxyltransferase subunit alpha [Verrucomicrobiota bacterium]MDH4469904.1 acetyl-CoA carboxylase carboxyltransferase subunit alpha [Verrucomicrobiae bacterium]